MCCILADFVQLSVRLCLCICSTVCIITIEMTLYVFVLCMFDVTYKNNMLLLIHILLIYVLFKFVTSILFGLFFVFLFFFLNLRSLFCAFYSNSLNIRNNNK